MKAAIRQQLEALASGELEELRKAMDSLWRSHRAMWLATYKPWGLEVIEQRYGGLRTRLESLLMTLRSYIAGEQDSIPELAGSRRKIFDLPMTQSGIMVHARAISPSYRKSGV